jgi:AraC-like DNA-binding protein
LLKNSINEPRQALTIFRRNLLFFNNRERQLKYQKQYLKSIFALADSYNRNGLLDSAEIINKRGLVESRENKKRYLYPYFLLSYGITKNFKKEYDLAIDSLIKGTQLLKNKKVALADGYLYLYKSFSGSRQPSKAIEYLKKNDSIFKENPEIIFQAKESYEYLLKYYKENKNKEKYLKTIESLLAIDSSIKSKQENLSQKIINKYEIPILISEKERLISELNKGNSSKETSILILVTITSIFLFLSFYLFRKNSENKKKFNTLINKFESKKKQSNEKNNDLTEITTTTTTTTGLSEELVKDILKKLLTFEKSNKFSKNNYTLNSLAKELKTNSTYLSKIINSSKKVNFSNYLNKLRIEYSIDKLKTNKSFRNYTIQAIAEEVGFNKAQSFSTAFQKETGISITYFIKQIKENNTIDYK